MAGPAAGGNNSVVFLEEEAVAATESKEAAANLLEEAVTKALTGEYVGATRKERRKDAIKSLEMLLAEYTREGVSPEMEKKIGKVLLSIAINGENLKTLRNPKLSVRLVEEMEIAAKKIVELAGKFADKMVEIGRSARDKALEVKRAVGDFFKAVGRALKSAKDRTVQSIGDALDRAADNIKIGKIKTAQAIGNTFDRASASLERGRIERTASRRMFAAKVAHAVGPRVPGREFEEASTAKLTEDRILARKAKRIAEVNAKRDKSIAARAKSAQAALLGRKGPTRTAYDTFSMPGTPGPTPHVSRGKGGEGQSRT